MQPRDSPNAGSHTQSYAEEHYESNSNRPPLPAEALKQRTLYWTGSYPPRGGISWAMVDGLLRSSRDGERVNRGVR